MPGMNCKINEPISFIGRIFHNEDVTYPVGTPVVVLHKISGTSDYMVRFPGGQETSLSTLRLWIQS